MVLAINAGYYNTKIGISEKELLAIPSRVQLNVDATRSIVHEGNVYEIGAGFRSLEGKDSSLCHTLMTKYSLLKYAREPQIDLMVALPFSQYLNRPYREKYRKSLIGEHTGVIDGKQVKVKVKDCTVLAEGAASYLANKELLQDKVVGILNFGGNTVLGVIVRNGEIIKDTITQLDLGSIKLEKALIDTINQEQLWNLQEYELFDVIASGDCKDTVNRVMMEHTQKVREQLLSKQWNLDRLELFVTGGTSTLLEPFISEKFNHVTFSDKPLYDDVLGLLKAGATLYGTK